MASEASQKNISRLGDSEQVFVSELLHELERAEATLNPWKNNLVKYYELYKMYQRNKHYDGLAQIFVPEILRATETIVSLLYKSIFGSNPWFEYTGRTLDEEPAARAETQLVNWQMDENRFRISVEDSLRQMAITGLTVRKVEWDFEQINRKRWARVKKTNSILDNAENKEPNLRKSESIEELETTKDHWVLKEVDLLGFYISDTSVPYHDIQRARWLGEEFEADKTYLREKIKKGWFADNNEEQIKEQNQEQRSDAQRLKDSLRLVSGYKNTNTNRGITFFERWGLLKAKYVYDAEQLKVMDLKEDDMVEAVVVLANRRWICKLEANPYWHGQKPFLACPYVPQEHEFAGIGVAQIGQSMQEELNDTRNQTMDNKTFILMCMWLKNRASGINNADLRVRPNGVIRTNDMNGLKPLMPPVLSGVGVNIEGVIKNDLRESVGAPSNLQGIAQSGVSTATESTQINQSALGRLGLTIQLYSELILKPLLVMVEYLNYQYYDTEKVIGIIGAQGVKFKPLDPDDIVGYKNVILKLSTDLDENPGVRRQQAMQFLTIVQQMPPQAIDYYWKLLDKIYKMFFPQGHDLSDVLPVQQSNEDLLEPQEEDAIMLMGHQVQVKRGDDDKQHLQDHQKEFENLKWALSDDSFKAFEKHILDHHNQMSAKLAAQAQQEQQMAMMQEQSGPSKLNPGQMTGTSAFTAPKANTPGQLNGALGT